MQSTGRINYYDILELQTSAPTQEVILAYERARHTYSGDNPAIYSVFTRQEADDLLVMIEEAYQVLGNDILRYIYDQRLRSGFSSLNELTYESILDASKKLQPEKKAPQKSLGYTVDPDFEKEIQTQTHWDGEFLKKVREYKQISIERMSAITKINTWYISALEKMERQNLPAIVFVRGYVIQIARALVLDDKKVADSFMKIYKNELEK
jgi:curved DNA-binding protein CbpA